MLTAFALCLAGLCVLMLGARYFIDEIALIAEAFGVPPVIVGRFFHSQYWVCAGHYCTGQPGKSESTIITREIPMLIVSVAALLVLGLNAPLNGIGPDALGRSDGLILLLLFAIFLYYTVVYSLASQFLRGRSVDPMVQEVTTEKAASAERPKFTAVNALTTLLGLAGVSFGADWTVEGASSIARDPGMAENLIGLTIVSTGTTLPELITCVMATPRGNGDIAIGNVVGSNLFNLLAIGAWFPPWLRSTSPREGISIMAFMAMLTAVLLPIAIRSGRTVTRSEGAFLLTGYLGFIIYRLAALG